MSADGVVDCVVVGGGWAGLVAARRLQQLGGAPVVLEKGDVEGGTGNVRISGGLLHMAWESPDADPAAKLARMLEETDGEIDLAVANTIAEESTGLIRWLEAEGVVMRPKSDAPYARWALYPFRPGMGRQLTDEFGPDRAMRTLYARFRDAGGDLRLGTRATALERCAGGAWRVRWRRRDEEGSIVAGAVVFADGGFQANPELLARYIGPNAGLCLLRAMRSGSGDALHMLTDAGAAIVGLGRVYGHMLSRDALQSDDLWPFPPLDELCLSGLLVDRNGARFPSERDSVEGLVTRLARSDDPRGFTAIFDDALWETAGQNNPFGMAVANPELVKRGGHFVSAFDVPSLASQLDIEPEAVRASIDAHNAGHADRPIKTLPYHAARVVPGITFTMGGARINGAAEVLDCDGEPLPGLYAIGSTAGGVHGGPRGGYVGGLAVGATLGLVSAASVQRRTTATGHAPRAASESRSTRGHP